MLTSEISDVIYTGKHDEPQRADFLRKFLGESLIFARSQRTNSKTFLPENKSAGCDYDNSAPMTWPESPVEEGPAASSNLATQTLVKKS